MRVATSTALAGMLIGSSIVLNAGGPGVAVAEAAAMPMKLELRVLVQNIYGRNKDECETRYRTIARKIREASPRFDLVIFNEHWKSPIRGVAACDPDVLTDALKKDGMFEGVTSQPRPEELWYSSGGLSFFTPHTIKEYVSIPFTESRPMPLSGTMMNRVEIAPGREIDVWANHLESTGSDGCDSLCRLGQIEDVVGNMEVYSTPDSGNRRNPVILGGDFNIQGPLSYMQRLAYKRTGYVKYRWSKDREYLDLMDSLQDSRDLWLEQNIVSPEKGFTYDCSNNSLLRDSSGKPKCGYRERIDYLFVMGDKTFMDAQGPPVKLKRMEVVKWKTPSGADVSDHYGLDATLEIDWGK